MRDLIKLSEEFEEVTKYIKYAEPLLNDIKKSFPLVSLKSFSEFKAFLDKYIHTLIRKYLVGTKSVKNCSGISPDFSEFAASSGFAVFTQRISGHVRNIFLSKDKAYIVDLSYIQFACGSDEEVVDALKAIYHDPYKAIKIEEIPIEQISYLDPPKQEYDSLYNPNEFIKLYDEDKDAQEEDLANVDKWKASLVKKKHR